MAFGSIKSALSSTRSSVSSSASSVSSFNSTYTPEHAVPSTSSYKRNRAVNPSGMPVDIAQIQQYDSKYARDSSDYAPRTVTLSSRYANPSGLPVDSEYVGNYSRKWQHEGAEAPKSSKKNGAYNLSGLEQSQAYLEKYNRKYGH